MVHDEPNEASSRHEEKEAAGSAMVVTRERWDVEREVSAESISVAIQSFCLYFDTVVWRWKR